MDSLVKTNHQAAILLAVNTLVRDSWESKGGEGR